MANPFLAQYTMPNLTTRRPFFDRVPSLSPDAKWSKIDCADYWEGTLLCVFAVMQWAAVNITNGVRVRQLAGGDWRVGNTNDTVGYTASTFVAAVLLAAHSVADSKGIAP